LILAFDGGIRAYSANVMTDKDGYFIQTFILWMNMGNWYNLSALNHPTKRSDKAFPSEAAWR
jgi:hypothetical protein